MGEAFEDVNTMFLMIWKPAIQDRQKQTDEGLKPRLEETTNRV